MEDAGYMIILAGYHSSVFQDFQSYFRTEYGLVEDDIRLVLDKEISSFITYELQPGIYIFKDLSEALLNILQLEYTASSCEIVMEFDDMTRKIKLVVRSGNIALRFDEKSFLNTILGFNHGWDYKNYIEYMSQNFVNINGTNKIQLKCDIVDGSVVNGLKQPLINSFVLDKPPGYRIFSEPETTHDKKIH